MSNIALNTGLRSLLTAQSALETVGHNVANANTPGYSRQRLSIGTDLPLIARGLLIGGGVKASSVQRSVDALLNRRILGQVTVAGRLQSRLNGMTEIEGLLGELGGNSIGGLMDGMFASISALSADPQDGILTTGLSQAAMELADRFRSLTDGLGDMQRDVEKELGLRVGEVNDLARELLAVNQQIVNYEGGGLQANDLRDRREQLLSEISSRVDVTSVEDASGALRVMVAGNTLVSSSRVYELSVAPSTGGAPMLQIEGAKGTVPVTGGTIGGLIGMAADFVPSLDGELDALARGLILEMNRLHSTGIPAGGPFHDVVGTNPVVDVDKDGKRTDELLSKAGLPFDVTSGELRVNVTDEATGAVEQHSIAISASHTTVGDLLDAINALPHVSAGIDGAGRVSVIADAGYAFDFSPRVDPNPDALGAFGGGKASLGSAQGPFALTDGDTLQLGVGASTFTVTFAGGDFKNVGAATAEEMAAVINADPNAQSLGIQAGAVDGHLVVQTLAEGSGASFDLVGGSVLGELGWAGLAGSTIAGHDNAVDVEIGGAYLGDADDRYTFQPNMDGTIGTTPGLMVDVFDQDGNLVASLDVGAGYVPGTELDVVHGVTATFGLGELSATEGDLFALDLVVDSDTSDVLVALGINSLFTGTGADDIALREELEVDPSKIATSLSGSSGDNALLLQMLGLQDRPVGSLGGETLAQRYEGMVGDFGFDVSSTVNALESNEALMTSLDQLKQSVSGVNVDEELVDMVKYEQAFSAASQYINVVNELQAELLNLL